MTSRIKLLTNYLLDEKRDIRPQLLLGSVRVLTELIKNCTYAEPFTSFVLSFEELLDRKTILEIIHDHERVAFAGIDQRDISRIWVLHEDHGRTELHCVVANIHLKKDIGWKHYYHGSDQKLFHNWQELINLKYCFSSPDEPARKQIKAPPLKDAGLEDVELIQKIDFKVVESVLAGKLNNQVEIVDYIRSLGYDAWGTKKQVSMRKPDFPNERPLRLTGEKYHRDFLGLPHLSTASNRKDSPKKDREELEREVNAGLLIRMNRMRKRFGTITKKNEKKEKPNDRKPNQGTDRALNREIGEPCYHERKQQPRNDERSQRNNRRTFLALGQSLKRKLVEVGLRILGGRLSGNQKTLLSKDGKPGRRGAPSRRHRRNLHPVKFSSAPGQNQDPRAGGGKQVRNNDPDIT